MKWLLAPLRQEAKLMSVRSTNLLWGALLVGLAACGGTAFWAVRAERHSGTTQPPPQTRTASSTRNLSFQPDAMKLARQLGARFLTGKNATTLVLGTLKIGSEVRPMQLTRIQTDDGETVQLTLDALMGSLTWDPKQGVLSAGRQATASQRELIERLVFDSPDEFVLMQFRGSSYHTVARGVRPVDAPDGYDGPLWTVIRVDDPEQDDAKRPASRWRLFYVNTTTGLIDRIESEVQGQRIVAEISAWSKQNGEKFPAQIVWTSDKQTLMQYSLLSVSLSSN